jgi:hypothetical protein
MPTDNYIPTELLPDGWWIYTIREMHRNKDEDLQIALEQLSSAFSAKYMVILMHGYANTKNTKQATGMGKTLNEAFTNALTKISKDTE